MYGTFISSVHFSHRCRIGCDSYIYCGIQANQLLIITPTHTPHAHTHTRTHTHTHTPHADTHSNHTVANKMIPQETPHKQLQTNSKNMHSRPKQTQFNETLNYVYYLNLNKIIIIIIYYYYFIPYSSIALL